MLRASHIVDSVRNRDEESIYPARISPRDDDYAPLVVQTLPPEVDDEDFQIPIHNTSKRHSEFKLSSSNRYSKLSK